jgi:hypothetical protein
MKLNGKIWTLAVDTNVVFCENNRDENWIPENNLYI